jgi:hypothetical protein
MRALRTLLGNRYSPYFGFPGSKNISWRPVHTIFWVYGLQELCLATATSLILGSRAPRTFLGDRYTFFWGVRAPRTLLGDRYTSFLSSRAPRTLLDDRYTPFFGFPGSKNPSWRPLRLFFLVSGLQEPCSATSTPLFPSYRAPRTKKTSTYKAPA